MQQHHLAIFPPPPLTKGQQQKGRCGHNVISMFLFFVSARIGVNELQNLQYLPRSSEPREILAEDRTRCHADHVGHGFDRQTTAAVGVLKAVHCGEM